MRPEAFCAQGMGGKVANKCVLPLSIPCPLFCSTSWPCVFARSRVWSVAGATTEASSEQAFVLVQLDTGNVVPAWSIRCVDYHQRNSARDQLFQSAVNFDMSEAQGDVAPLHSVVPLCCQPWLDCICSQEM